MLVKQQQGLRGSTTWDPQGYQQFSRLRERPVIELLDHLPLQAPASIYDLGCGTGIATRLLAERWPEAQLFGVDSSAEMLAEARALPVNAQWLNSDIGQWEPKQPASLLFAAAVLHFMEDHENLLPRLLGNLHAGGYLALHMPNWRDAPWYHLMLRALSECGPAGRVIGTLELRKFMSARNVLSLDCYYRLLAPLTSKLDGSRFRHCARCSAPWMTRTVRPFCASTSGFWKRTTRVRTTGARCSRSSAPSSWPRSEIALGRSLSTALQAATGLSLRMRGAARAGLLEGGGVFVFCSLIFVWVRVWRLSECRAGMVCSPPE